MLHVTVGYLYQVLQSGSAQSTAINEWFQVFLLLYTMYTSSHVFHLALQYVKHG